MIKLTKPKYDIGYSSHGQHCDFEEIIELEQDRGNEPFINYTKNAIEPLQNRSAIWLTNDPIQALIYALPADDWNKTRQEIINENPDWKNEIVKVNLQDYECVEDTDDGDGGELYLLMK